MQRTRFGDMACSIARTLDIIGEPWSPLILRDIFIGITRFEQIQQDLDISRKVLTERLKWLVVNGVLERCAYSERPPRSEYRLTTKGLELCDLLLVMVRWGDRWMAGEAGPPVLYRHRACGQISHVELHCSVCDRPMHATDIDVEPGPGNPEPSMDAGHSGKSELRVERAGIADAGELLTLQRAAYVTEARLYDDPELPALTQSLPELADELRSVVALKAVVDHRIVGAVRARVDGSVLRIGRLTVSPDWQGRGVGSRLLDEIENQPDLGVDRAALFTGHRSAGNLRLYARHGYREEHREKVHERLVLVHLTKPIDLSGAGA
jgi:DNA-binding HxlR family transcriptional regulator/GNAT superfamily N-acetyltransferase